MKYIEGEKFSKIFEIDLASTEFIECVFEGLDLSNQSMKNSKFIECSFVKCNCSGTNLLNTTFREVLFEDCKLMGVNWSSCQKLSHLKIIGTILDFSVFQGVNIVNGLFKNSSIRDVDFSQSNLAGADFSGANLRGTSFNGCDLRDADFRGAVEYNIDPEFSKVKNAKFSMPEAISLLRSLEIIIER